MSPKIHLAPCWNTASFGASADMSRVEQSALIEHIHLCRLLCGRFHGLRAGATAMQGWMAGRLMTTTLALCALSLLAGWAL